MALDREQVIKAAIELMNEAGLDGLSLRRLATRLGVQAPALYWHFKNKQELLDQMAETILARSLAAEPPERPEEWDEWVAARARELRESLNRYRDGAMLAASTRPQGVQLETIERYLRVLCAVGLSPAESMWAMIAVGNYVSGFTLDEQADRLRGGDESGPQDRDSLLRLLEEYPLMAASVLEIGDPQSSDNFERGLQVVLDGIRARVARAASSG
ncbi:TetR/AcrR family transcriptional regulator C-terminal domain-containing protein [Dactylosporangium darangshiense]|uniref:TetR/AcrR family transcriptional regulator C-terminal domain-containing protein n=1 Tax=Dactylosporangium darangshiense TaxID=579108 RepID=UPI0031EBD0CB